LEDILHTKERPVTLRAMATKKDQGSIPGTWIVKDVPRDLMHRMKVAAAVEKKTMKQLLFELAEAHLAEMEKKGILPKGK
jgi:hypothetical protein